jgi:hypothetical protein
MESQDPAVESVLGQLRDINTDFARFNNMRVNPVLQNFLVARRERIRARAGYEDSTVAGLYGQLAGISIEEIRSDRSFIDCQSHCNNLHRNIAASVVTPMTSPALCRKASSKVVCGGGILSGQQRKPKERRLGSSMKVSAKLVGLVEVVVVKVL